MVFIMCAVVALTAQDAFTPARYVAGPIPTVPTQALGSGEVVVEVTITETGQVDLTTLLRVTPPFIEPFVAAVRTWQFQPAEEEDRDRPPALNPKPRHRIRSAVLVAGLFRPPTLNTPTLGPSPTDVAQGSRDIPLPITTVAPFYPPQALFDGVVLVEVEVSATGAVANATVVRSAPPFDATAVDAARQWTFRPASLHGRPVAALAYLVLGFRQPVTGPR